MKVKLTRLSLLVCLVAIGLISFGQLSNDATTIFLQNPSANLCPSPAPGSYTLSISYLDLNTGNITPTTNYAANISYSGTTIVISVPTASFPTVSTVGYDLSQTTGNLNFGTGTYFFDNGQYNCSALPLTLISFNAARQSNNTIKLTWVTADETQMDHYYIERNSAENTVADMLIGDVIPLNNGSSQTTYQFTDQYPFNGNNYYRLKMVGQSGYVKYSNVLRVGCSGCTATPPLLNCSAINIAGPYSICSGSAGYSLSSQIFYSKSSDYTWSFASNDCYATLSNTAGSSTTLNKSSWDGSVQLKVSVSRCTNATKDKYKYITLGIPNSGDAWTSADQSLVLKSMNEGYNYIFENTWVYFRVYGATSASQYTYNGGSISNTPYFDGTYMSFYMDPGTSATFSVAASNGSCSQTLYYAFIAQSNPYCCSYYSIAPNPATSDLTVFVDDEKLKNQKIQASPDQGIQRVIVMNKFGAIMAQQSYPSGTRKAFLNVNSLPSDIYVAKIFNGEKWTSIKFMKK